ncbi:Transposase [Caenorhabditis elegans]|uniref:Transposase n=1 Tax=Caenorhabditis elegans TaxID=6239 RepID=O01841_CAEEL|nr:Transposase [Caenorhabditis elegans]CCD71979.2 Transposase [Caenorhabditis elegans]
MDTTMENKALPIKKKRSRNVPKEYFQMDLPLYVIDAEIDEAVWQGYKDEEKKKELKRKLDEVTKIVELQIAEKEQNGLNHKEAKRETDAARRKLSKEIKKSNNMQHKYKSTSRETVKKIKK